MDMRVLAYYLTIAEEENITKASKILHVTQPTLSRQIMQLEEELGTKLFIRTKHKIILTEAGTLFKRRAEEIISLMEKSKYELNQENQVSGKISIGSGEFLTLSPSLTETTVLIWKKNPVISPAFNIFIKYLQTFLNSD